ncbi:MAG: hypothetical protein ACYS8W_02355 [Planctomycetota bacterium]|jgi:hypothetical protein
MKQLLIEKHRKLRSKRWVISRWNLRPTDDVEKWPVLAASAPEPEQWMLTGRGSAGVIRKKPDGTAACFIANLSLERGGIFEYGFLDDISPTANHEEFLEDALRDNAFYPAVKSGVEWAARHFWDTAEFGSSLPLPPPPPERMLFKMLPPSQEFMHKTLAGARGLPSTIPEKLAKVVREIIEDDKFDPDGLPIFGEGFFRVGKPDRLFKVIHGSPIFQVTQTQTGLKGCAKSPSIKLKDGTQSDVFTDGLGRFELSHDRLIIKTGPLAALGAFYLIMNAASGNSLQFLHANYEIAPTDFSDLLNAA